MRWTVGGATEWGIGMSGSGDLSWVNALYLDVEPGEGEETVDAYAVLGVRPDATAAQVRAAYRRRVQLLHPDRHMRPDGTVPQHVHEAFCQLGEAAEVALQACATGQRATPYVPRQRVSRHATAHPMTARRESPAAVMPSQREVATPAASRRPLDPVAVLEALPRRCAAVWTVDELEFWHHHVLPKARQHLVRARTAADTAGPITGTDTTLATAHALLSSALSELSGRRLHPIRLTTAYDLLEERLPRTVVAGLPPRVVRLPRNRLLAALIG